MKDAHILLPDAICAGDAAEGPVVIFDDDHYYMGGLMAELLRGQGHEVTLVTPSSDVSHWTHNTLEQGRIQKRLIEMDVKIVPLQNVVHIGKDHVTLSCVYTERERKIACGTFVPVTMRRPVDQLFHDLMARPELTEGGPQSINRIGDCLAPGIIAAAVYAGHRYARELGAGVNDPDRVPFRRELPQLAAE